WHTKAVSYDITISKKTNIKKLKILMISDIHLNKIIGNSRIKNLVRLSDKIKPDIILLDGDVIDRSMKPFQEEKMGKELKKINAPLGVYAVLGNHEYYGNDIPKFIKEMSKIKIPVLTDETKLINNPFYLVGRKDYTDKNRKSIGELISTLDKNKPIIMMDHQP